MHQTPDRKGDQAECGRDSVYCALCSDLYLSRDTVSSAQCCAGILSSVLELHGDDEL